MEVGWTTGPPMNELSIAQARRMVQRDLIHQR